jgi:hypothetical protein
MLGEALMRRSLLTAFAVTLVFGAAGAFAQDGDLSGVTMRVLDDVSDIRTVILELDASRGEGEEDAAERGGRSDEASSADRGAPDASASEDDHDAREALHEPDDDERGEGKLEDNDVERPAAAPTP